MVSEHLPEMEMNGTTYAPRSVNSWCRLSLSQTSWRPKKKWQTISSTDSQKYEIPKPASFRTWSLRLASGIMKVSSKHLTRRILWTQDTWNSCFCDLKGWLVVLFEFSDIRFSVVFQKFTSFFFFSAAANVSFNRRLHALASGPNDTPAKMLRVNGELFEKSVKLHFGILPWYKWFHTPVWSKLVEEEDFFYGWVFLIKFFILKGWTKLLGSLLIFFWSLGFRHSTIIDQAFGQMRSISSLCTKYFWRQTSTVHLMLY